MRINVKIDLINYNVYSLSNRSWRLHNKISFVYYWKQLIRFCVRASWCTDQIYCPFSVNTNLNKFTQSSVGTKQTKSRAQRKKSKWTVTLASKEKSIKATLASKKVPVKIMLTYNWTTGFSLAAQIFTDRHENITFVMNWAEVRILSGTHLSSFSSAGSAWVIIRRWRSRCHDRSSGCCSSFPSCWTWSRLTCTRRCWGRRDEFSAARRPETNTGGRGHGAGGEVGLRHEAGAGAGAELRSGLELHPGRHREDEKLKQQCEQNLQKHFIL